MSLFSLLKLKNLTNTSRHKNTSSKSELKRKNVSKRKKKEKRKKKRGRKSEIVKDSTSTNFYIHGGCNWIGNCDRAIDHAFLYRYNTQLNKFYKVFDESEIITVRYRHTMVLREIYEKTKFGRVKVKSLIIFGGLFHSTYTNDLYEIQLSPPIQHNNEENEKNENSGNNIECRVSKMEIENEGKIAPRGFHQALYQEKLDKMYVFGGKNSLRRFNDVYELDFRERSWNKIRLKQTFSKNAPRCRGGFSMDWIDKLQSKFIIFGGLDEFKNDLNDVWQFQIFGRKWKKWKCKGSIPCPRSSHSSQVMNNEYLFVFGGSDESLQFNDFYRLDFKSKWWTRLKLDCKSPISNIYIHDSGIFEKGGKVKFFTFGGFTSRLESTNSCYEFDVFSKENEKKMWNFRENLYQCDDYYDVIVQTVYH